MAGSISFNGYTVRGVVLPFFVPGFTTQPLRTHFAGVRGTSEIRVGPGERRLELEIVAHDNHADAEPVDRIFFELDQLLETHELLSIVRDNGHVSDFENCTFDAWSQQRPILPGNGTIEGYWTQISLTFTQLLGNQS